MEPRPGSARRPARCPPPIHADARSGPDWVSRSRWPPWCRPCSRPARRPGRRSPGPRRGDARHRPAQIMPGDSHLDQRSAAGDAQNARDSPLRPIAGLRDGRSQLARRQRRRPPRELLVPTPRRVAAVSPAGETAGVAQGRQVRASRDIASDARRGPCLSGLCACPNRHARLRRGRSGPPASRRRGRRRARCGVRGVAPRIQAASAEADPRSYGFQSRRPTRRHPPGSRARTAASRRWWRRRGRPTAPVLDVNTRGARSSGHR